MHVECSNLFAYCALHIAPNESWHAYCVWQPTHGTAAAHLVPKHSVAAHASVY